MTSFEKFRKDRGRIDEGDYRLNDFAFRICQCCVNKYSQLCHYVQKGSQLVWACGFCQRDIYFKDKGLVYKIAIDADSLVNKALHRAPDDIEKQYFEFCIEIGKIKSAPFINLHTYEKGDSVEFKILLTPSTNFRYDVSPIYKANRPPRSEERKALMKMILQRLNDYVVIKKGVEADDVAIWYAKQGWMVSAIDKDVKNACPTYCYDYNKYEWQEPRPPHVVEQWYLMQAMIGDSVDNIKGAKGIGEAKALKIVDELDYPEFAFIIPYFDNYEDALMSMRLVRMDQWDGEKVVLWEPNMQEDLI